MTGFPRKGYFVARVDFFPRRTMTSTDSPARKGTPLIEPLPPFVTSVFVRNVFCIGYLAIILYTPLKTCRRRCTDRRCRSVSPQETDQSRPTPTRTLWLGTGAGGLHYPSKQGR